jgi:choline dehydrogenase-like flavoprotein
MFCSTPNSTELASKLSGIGDKAQLQQHGITPVVHLPGVGANLQGIPSHLLFYRPSYALQIMMRFPLFGS